MNILCRSKVANNIIKGYRRYTSLEHDFYKVSTGGFQANSSASFVRGEILDRSIDFRCARPGDIIDVPYEITVSQIFRDLWQSGCYSYDRINTSAPFAKSLGLQDQVIPFNLMLFLAGSMSHADNAKLQIGYQKGTYHWPAFAGDTFKRRYVIRSLTATSDDRNSIFTIHCQLTNQRNEVVFSCEKTILFPFKVPPSVEVVPATDVQHSDFFLNHLVQQASYLQQKGSQTLCPVRPGQLILHTLARPITRTHSMQLATLARLTHGKYFDTLKNTAEELLVPGGLVLGLTCSLAARDLHEVTN